MKPYFDNIILKKNYLKKKILAKSIVQHNFFFKPCKPFIEGC